MFYFQEILLISVSAYWKIREFLIVNNISYGITVLKNTKIIMKTLLLDRKMNFQ